MVKVSIGFIIFITSIIYDNFVFNYNLGILITLWFFTASLTSKYERNTDYSFKEYINPYMKSYVVLFIIFISIDNFFMSFKPIMIINLIYFSSFEFLIFAIIWYFSPPKEESKESFTIKQDDNKLQ